MAVQLRPEPRQLEIHQLDIRRLDLDEYHRMIEVSLFDEDERVELIGGVLHRMSPRGPKHAGVLRRLLRLFFTQLGDAVEIGAQDPITILTSDSEPEPDLTLLVPREDNYISRHPQPHEVLLLVEIAETSLEHDRKIKGPVYAAAGIEDYWIVNLVDNQIEVYRELAQLADGTAIYRRQTVHRAGEIIVPLRFRDCEIDVASVLPSERPPSPGGAK